METQNGMMRTLDVTVEDILVGDMVRHDGVIGLVSAILVEDGRVTLRFEAGGFVVFETGEFLKVKRITTLGNLK